MVCRFNVKQIHPYLGVFFKIKDYLMNKKIVLFDYSLSFFKVHLRFQVVDAKLYS